MELRIGDFNRQIRSFNVSTRAQGDNTFSTRLVIECASADEDTALIADTLTQALNQGEEFLIYNGDIYYRFDDFKFDSIDKYISETSVRLSITFIK